MFKPRVHFQKRILPGCWARLSFTRAARQTTGRSTENETEKYYGEKLRGLTTGRSTEDETVKYYGEKLRGLTTGRSTENETQKYHGEKLNHRQEYRE